jgi:hypothetical protein
MKKLTKTGESFIKTICSTNEDLLSGKYYYNLPFSNIKDTPTTFTSSILNRNGSNIGNNSQLAEELIYCFNLYGEEAGVDSNVLAAQAFVDSEYRTWHYSKYDSGSGIVSFPAIRVYTHIVTSERPQTFEGLNNLFFDETDINKITLGLTNSEDRLSYLYKGRVITTETLEIAIGNRQILHQNIINNPQIMIRALASIMKEILERNDGSTANALLAYKTNWKETASSYPEMADNISKAYGDTILKKGIDYVNNVFRCLGDENNDKMDKKITKPVGSWFGYDIDFSVDKFSAYLG